MDGESGVKKFFNGPERPHKFVISRFIRIIQCRILRPFGVSVLIISEQKNGRRLRKKEYTRHIRLRGVFAAVILGLLGGRMAYAQPVAEYAATLYVVNHGWHTGLVVRRGDIPGGLWPEQRQAPPGEYVEIGWGQREFYQIRDPSLLQAVRAALWPSPSVLHLMGFNGPVAARFPHSAVIALKLDAAAMRRVALYISDAYQRDQTGGVKRMGQGLYGDSRFFAGRENFHLFRTCNVWVARAVRLAGCPVDAGITAGTVMASAARCAAR